MFALRLMLDEVATVIDDERRGTHVATVSSNSQPRSLEPQRRYLNHPPRVVRGSSTDVIPERGYIEAERRYLLDERVDVHPQPRSFDDERVYGLSQPRRFDDERVDALGEPRSSDRERLGETVEARRRLPGTRCIHSGRRSPRRRRRSRDPRTCTVSEIDLDLVGGT
jgi:hypothetical protein